ncbi:hypothetical protein KKH43_03290 [Patescibacteria group bacterium]|nr:hypothetical protein [Patescibacteria group bacterium]
MTRLTQEQKKKIIAEKKSYFYAALIVFLLCIPTALFLYIIFYRIGLGLQGVSEEQEFIIYLSPIFPVVLGFIFAFLIAGYGYVSAQKKISTYEKGIEVIGKVTHLSSKKEPLIPFSRGIKSVVKNRVYYTFQDNEGKTHKKCSEVSAEKFRELEEGESVTILYLKQNGTVDVCVREILC